MMPTKSVYLEIKSDCSSAQKLILLGENHYSEGEERPFTLNTSQSFVCILEMSSEKEKQLKNNFSF